MQGFMLPRVSMVSERVTDLTHAGNGRTLGMCHFHAGVTIVLVHVACRSSDRLCVGSVFLFGCMTRPRCIRLRCWYVLCCVTF